MLRQRSTPYGVGRTPEELRKLRKILDGLRIEFDGLFVIRRTPFGVRKVHKFKWTPKSPIELRKIRLNSEKSDWIPKSPNGLWKVRMNSEKSEWIPKSPNGLQKSRMNTANKLRTDSKSDFSESESDLSDSLGVQKVRKFQMNSKWTPKSPKWAPKIPKELQKVQINTSNGRTADELRIGFFGVQIGLRIGFFGVRRSPKSLKISKILKDPKNAKELRKIWMNNKTSE